MHILTFCHSDAFVHSIVNAFVGFTYPIINFMGIFLYYVYAFVGTCAIDFNDYQNLRPLVVMVEQLLHQIEDTMTMAGSEAYIASLSFYNSAKDAAKRDIPGAKAVYEDLRLRFPQANGRKKEEDKK